MSAHITKFIIEDDANDLFLAHLDNGGVRIGMVGGVIFDFPSSHAEYPRLCAITLDGIESEYDAIYARNMCV